ncbi:uncharacterized protein LOC128883686 isoform X2 [Hylaeus volcanicus]|uniref:uncharacterized protein LOC128883686 isoform X2 n=1 Tax=Hylaeus volcanicus TaxID=313075 RepID=UPI0023B821B2|nr:uncharacterized protein LOC128883686 isoform X2 [Hylaeus volcanicus]
MEHLKAHGLSKCLRGDSTGVDYHICENIPSFQEKSKQCEMEITNALQACAYLYLLDEGSFTAQQKAPNPSTLTCHDFSDVLELQLSKVGRALRSCEEKGFDIPLVPPRLPYSKESGLAKEESGDQSGFLNSTITSEKEATHVNVEKLSKLLKVNKVDKELWQNAFGCPLNKIEFCECFIQTKFHKKTLLPEVFNNATNPLDLYLLPHLYEEEIHSLDWECETTPEGQLNLLVKRSPRKFSPFLTEDFIYVDTEKSLKKMIHHLKSQTVFSLDTEHHDRHSYSGITCLLQISTEFHDYIVDPLHLRKHLWLLNKVTTDPAILKILHGADCDILWLQEDFSIYIVNMFDTCIASQVLAIQGGNSLENLLYYFCRVRTDKKYQLEDWRKRPLTEKMIDYARKDTHYLLYIADSLINALVDRTEKEETNKVLQVLQKSRLLTLKKATQSCKKNRSLETLRKDLPYDPLSDLLLMHLVEWRDAVACSLDESPCTLLSNALLKRLATNRPVSWEMFQRCVYPLKPVLMQLSENIIAIIQRTVNAFQASEQTDSVLNEKLSTKKHYNVLLEPSNESRFAPDVVPPTNLAQHFVMSPEKSKDDTESTFKIMDSTHFVFYEIPKFQVHASIQSTKETLECLSHPLAGIEELYNLKEWNCGDRKHSLFAKAVGQRVVVNCLKSTTRLAGTLTQKGSTAEEMVQQTLLQQIPSKIIKPKELDAEMSILKCASRKNEQGKKQKFQNIILSAADMMKNVTPATSLSSNECRKSTRHTTNTKQARDEKKESCQQSSEQVGTRGIQPLTNSLKKRKRLRKASSIVNAVIPTCAVDASYLKIPSLPRTHRFFESGGAMSEKYKGPNSSKKRRRFGFK